MKFMYHILLADNKFRKERIRIFLNCSCLLIKSADLQHGLYQNN
jgi:hypothetical protein